MSVKVQCKLCGKLFQTLESHLHFTHNTTVSQYKMKFPNSPTISNSLRKHRSEMLPKDVRKEIGLLGYLSLVEKHSLEELSKWRRQGQIASSKVLREKWSKEQEKEEWKTKLRESANRPKVKKKKVKSYLKWLEKHPEHRAHLSKLMRESIVLKELKSDPITIQKRSKGLKSFYKTAEGQQSSRERTIKTLKILKRRFPDRYGSLYRSGLESSISNILHEVLDEHKMTFTYENFMLNFANGTHGINDFYIPFLKVDIEGAGFDWLESHRRTTENKKRVLEKQGIICLVVRSYNELNELRTTLVKLVEKQLEILQ